MLTVEGGPQGRRRLRLSSGVTTIGAGIENDVVLFDDDLSEHHFELRVVEDDVSLRATGGPVNVIAGASVRVLGIGSEVRCRDGTQYQVGANIFLVESQSRSIRVRGRRILPRPAAWTGFAVGLTVAVTCLIAAPLDAAVDERRPHASMTAQSAPVRPASASIPSPVSGQPGLRETERELAARGLDDVLVSIGQDGAIEADGTILPTQRNEWERIRRWFDARFGDHALLIDRVLVSAPRLPITIDAISAGEHPFVIDRNGHKLFVGAALGGGWTIAAIERGAVVVRAGTRTFAVRF